MKKLVCFFLLIFVGFCFSACKKESTQSAEAENVLISNYISENFDTSSLSEETIKKLSAVVRSNIKNGDKVEASTTVLNPNVYSIVSSFENKTLPAIKTITKISSTKNWVVFIPKSKLLSVFAENNQTVANIKNISLEKDETGRTQSFTVSEKKIHAKDFENKLGLPSNKITKITNANSGFLVYGFGEGFGEEFDVFLENQKLQEKQL